MKTFLESLLGLKSAKKGQKDNLLSKECRLFMGIERKTNHVCYAAKSLLKDAVKRDTVRFHVDYRLDQFKKDGVLLFVPDEVIMAYRFPDINKTPNMDDEYRAFSNFLRNKQPECTVSLRETVFREENGIKDGEPLPMDKFKSWCAIQDSKELNNYFPNDKRFFEEFAAQPGFDEKAQEHIRFVIGNYTENDQLLSRLLAIIEDIPDKKKRMEVYKDIEPLIEKSSYYKRLDMDDIGSLLNMPPEDMRPLHALAFELLQEELEQKPDNLLSHLSSPLKDHDLKKLKDLLLYYHKKKGNTTEEEEQELMDLDYKSLAIQVQGLAKQKGCYSDTNIPGGLGRYPDAKEAGKDTGGGQQAPADNKRPAVSQPSAAGGQQPVPKPRTGTRFEDQLKAQAGVKAVATASTAPAGTAPSAPKPAEGKGMDVATEKAASLSRLARGSLLRKEIERYKAFPEITSAQLEWAFSQPYITLDSLIADGTMVGSIMNTVYFDRLNERIATYTGFGDETFNPVEEEVLSAYAAILTNDLRYYGAQIENGGETGEESATVTEIKRLMLDNQLVLQNLQPIIDNLRQAREEARLQAELDQSRDWLRTLYDPAFPVNEKQQLAEKWVSMLFLRRGSRLFLKNVLSDIREFNAAGSPATLYTSLAFMVKLSQAGLDGADFHSPDAYDTVSPNQLGWLDTVVCQLFAGVAMHDWADQAGADLARVQAVCRYFEENGKKLLPWIEKDLRLKEQALVFAKEKVSVFTGLADYALACFEGNPPADGYPVKDRLEEIDARFRASLPTQPATSRKPARKAANQKVPGENPPADSGTTPPKEIPVDTPVQTDGNQGGTIPPNGNTGTDVVPSLPVIEFVEKKTLALPSPSGQDKGTAADIPPAETVRELPPEMNDEDFPLSLRGKKEGDEFDLPGLNEALPEEPDFTGVTGSEVTDEQLQNELPPADEDEDPGDDEDEDNPKASETDEGKDPPGQTDEGQGNSQPGADTPLAEYPFYILARDHDFPHPKDPKWTFPSSHLAAVLPEDVCKKFREVEKKDDYRLLCFDVPAAKEYLLSLNLQQDEIKRKETIYTMMLQWNKSLSTSGDALQLRLYQHMLDLRELLQSLKS